LSIRPDPLTATIAELASRPGHEKVRTLITHLLTEHLGAKSTDITFEKRVVEIKGRIDALLGRTVIEFKSNLAKERKDADAQLSSYLPHREKETGEPWVGIATDGYEYTVHRFRDGQLVTLASTKATVDNPRALTAWLESVVLLADSLAPDVDAIRRELGRESVTYAYAIRELETLWEHQKTHPEAILKRDLWHRLLGLAYGSDVEAPALFLQHTYLTIVAKVIATLAFEEDPLIDGEALLSGRTFENAGITGTVENDFFDWLLVDPRGPALVTQIASQVKRFRLQDIQVDVLKGLYESLIDPDQRHYLGEYYTPDWLAERVVEAAVDKPLEQRVMDPSCGSGTFLFHAIRHLVKAGQAAKLPPKDIVELALERIAGIEVHPVAVIFARTTFLLALLPVLKAGRPATISIPVFLGDALQWSIRDLFNAQELEVVVPAPGEALKDMAPVIRGNTSSATVAGRTALRFPGTIAREKDLLDDTIKAMLELSERKPAAPSTALASFVRSKGVTIDGDVAMLTETYTRLVKLQEEGRNHIWGYVVRNLSRPVWLSNDQQKADVIVGNPPWVRYSVMGENLKTRFKEECQATGLWVGGKVATSQDMCAYFFARVTQLYLRKQGADGTPGKIAMVLPYAAMRMEPYREFLKGRFKDRAVTTRDARVEFTAAWTFDHEVGPLFPVPACVLFAKITSRIETALPATVLAYKGRLPRRDASREQAAGALSVEERTWPREDVGVTSPYKERFRAGATLFPRRFIFVERVSQGRLGDNPEAPYLRGRVTSQDKEPWKDIAAVEGAVEIEFVRPCFLGENIAPFRPLPAIEAVIPYGESSSKMLDAASAMSRGHAMLSRWLASAEEKWETNKKSDMSLSERFNYQRGIQNQFPMPEWRVLYSASGTNLAACLLSDARAVIEHKLYWTAVSTEDEGHFLTAILNAEGLRKRAERFQSQGQFGARDFDKVVFNLAIPMFDPKKAPHRNLAAAGKRAATLASLVPLDEGAHFTRHRKRIRQALIENGVMGEIEAMVETMLGA
jgi:N-6 DNA Methylase